MRQIRISLLTLAGLSALIFLVAGGCVSQPPQAEPLQPTGTNVSGPLHPGPNDPKIAYVAGVLLENLHYLQRPLDTELSTRFFDGYIETLDSRHENFLQSDLAEFDHYRTNLDKYTTLNRNTADLTPAFAIYNRYLERYRQHTVYVEELLKQNKFKFNTADTIQLDRRHEPFPKDLEEAKALWREHLQYEYLYQEKLPRELTETNGTVLVSLNTTNAADIPKALLRHYQWGLRMTTNSDSDFVMQLYLNALAHAYDPHSDYFSAPKAVDFSIQMSLSLFGIGAQLNEDDGYCTINALLPGGPAAKSKKLLEKDRIIAVAQSNQPPVDIVDMDLEKAIQLIRGPKGTVVRLTISPLADRTSRKVVELVRDEIKLDDAAAKAKIIDVPNGSGGTNRLGVLDVPSFYATIPTAGNEGHAGRYTSEDVIKLVNKLKAEHVSGIIIDLRSNPGGSLEEAVRFTGLFIKDGPVVLARANDGEVKVRADTDPGILYDGPIEVLINRFSASASEIAAAALQDYGRAIVVGDVSTHGKGTVQSLNPLRPFVAAASPSATNDPGTIKITIDKFYRVTGASTQLKGVMPDIVLPDTLSYSKMFGESSLDNPLPWDTIAPANFTALNLVKPYLADLSQRSAARVATNQDFTYIREDIAEMQKHETDKTVTLNERKAIEERKTNAARNRARDTERNARPASQATVYEITLENAEKPGLPAPQVQTNEMTTAHADVKVPGTVKKPAVVNAPSNDPTLDEAERILQDYITLLPKGDHLADGN